MKRIIPLLLVVAFMLVSCTANYYLVVSDTETPIYATEDSYTPVTTVPANKAFVYESKSVRLNTRYGSFNGHSLYSKTWQRLAKLNKKEVQNLIFTEGKGYTYNGISSSSGGSYSSGKKSSASSGGGTVNIKGYTRANGTYVQPHTRSPPGRH